MPTLLPQYAVAGNADGERSGMSRYATPPPGEPMSERYARVLVDETCYDSRL